METMKKSNKFQRERRYAPGCMKKPSARIFASASAVNTSMNTYSTFSCTQRASHCPLT